MNPVSVIGLVFSGIMLLLSLANLVISRLRDTKKDTTEEQREMSSLKEGILKANMKLDQVCATTNETRTDIKYLNNSLTALDKRVSVMERDLETAFLRIDELRNTKQDRRIEDECN